MQTHIFMGHCLCSGNPKFVFLGTGQFLITDWLKITDLLYFKKAITSLSAFYCQFYWILIYQPTTIFLLKIGLNHTFKFFRNSLKQVFTHFDVLTFYWFSKKILIKTLYALVKRKMALSKNHDNYTGICVIKQQIA